MAGVPELRQAVADQLARNQRVQADPETEITITTGATEGLFDVITAVVRPDDEVIIFEPCYDAYAPAIELQGGYPVNLPMQFPNYSIDWNMVERHVNRNTRAIILNTPHNPTGSILSKEDLNALAQITQNNNMLIISDEVYEHMTFDQHVHHSILSHPALAARSFVMGSFGKSLHVTGWKVGYCVAPKALTAELRRVHQFVTFASSTPMQYALADYINETPDFGQQTRAFYQRKRDYFRDLMKDTPFVPLANAGTYFQLYRFDSIKPQMSDVDFAQWMIEQVGVAVIPISVFYYDGIDHQVVRFCFAKEDTTLEKAVELICKI
jgi:methionine aminotransferase